MTLRIQFVGVLFTILMIQISSVPSSANSVTKRGCIPGVYLVQEGSGTQSLWTFANDGTLHVTSSAQGALNFSDGHGAWKHIPSGQVKATQIDFNYSNSGINGGFPPSGIARVDAQLSFSEKCNQIKGSFELRFFDPETEDALDPASDTGTPITDTLMGRRVKTK